MFREELEDLKNRYLGRLSILHVLESEAQDIDLFTGRVDAEKCAALFQHLDRPPLGRHRLHLRPRADDAGDRRRAEGARARGRARSSSSSSPPASPAAARSARPSTAASTSNSTTEATDHARRRHPQLPHAEGGQSLLDAALEASLDAPYACKAGVCSTCRAKVLEGEAEMAVNHALEDYEVRQGYVLTCQCFPLSDKIVVSYDQ